MFDDMVKEQVQINMRTKHPKMYHVMMHNDDITPMEYVITVLMEVFHYNFIDAYNKTKEIHESKLGESIVGTYDRKAAEDFCDQVEVCNKLSGHHLQVTTRAAQNND